MERRLVTWALLGACAAVLACMSGAEQAVSAPASGAPDATAAPPGATFAASDVATPASEPAAAPPADGCDDKGKTRSERVRCKFAALADEGAAAADALHASSSMVLTSGQRESFAATRDRIRREKGRADDRLKALARKRDAPCRFSECDGTVYPGCAVGNRDGVCDDGEDCLEVLGDGIGDDRQPCSPKKGRKAEDCVLVCDEEAVCRDDASLDDEVEATLEEALDEGIGHAKAMKGALDRTGPAVAAALAVLPTGAPGEDLCAIDAHGLQRTNDLVAVSVKVAAVSTRGIADVVERACDTAAFGFSCGVCCIVLEAVSAAAGSANAYFEAVDGIVTSATLDAALACVDQVNQKTSQGLADLMLLQEGLDRVEATQAEIVRLLLTAPGQRPGYPQP